MRALGQAGQSPRAGSVRFAASGNFAHHEVHAIENRHWQLARQAQQQPFLDHFFEFVPAVLQGSCIRPYSVKTRYGTVIPTLFEQFVRRSTGGYRLQKRQNQNEPPMNADQRR